MKWPSRQPIGKLAICLGVGFLILAPRARGDSDAAVMELSLDALLNLKVEVASKMEEKVEDAPGVVTVITKQEIKNFGSVSLVDIFNRVPSLQHMSSHLWVQAKPVIRGDLITHADNHTLVLINGRPFRDGLQSNSNWTLYTSFPVDLIERIEIVRGPGSVLYGSNAISGVINIITRTAEDQATVMATAGAGSFGAKAGSATALVNFHDLKISIGGNYFVEDGWDFKATTKFDTVVETKTEKYGEDMKAIAAFLEYKRFKAQVSYSNPQYVALGSLPVWEFLTTISGKRLFADLGYTQPLTERISLAVNGTHNYWEETFTDFIGQSTDKVGATVVEAMVNGRVGERTDFVLGGLTEFKEYWGYEGSETVYPSGFNEKHYSAYLSVNHRIIDPLKLIAGVQYNLSESEKKAVVPRLGGIYAFNEDITLKLLYGAAFRSASPLEEYINFQYVLVGNPELEPELVTTYDAQLFVNTSRAQYTVSFFHSQMDQLIGRAFVDTSVDFTATFVNSDRFLLFGAELEVKAPITQSLYATGSLTYQKEKDDRLFIPVYMAKLGAFYTIGGLTAGVFGSLFGEPNEVEGFNPNTADLNPEAQAIKLLSVNLKYDFERMGAPMAIEAYANNMLDDGMDYPEFSRRQVNTLPIGPGRAFYGRLSVKF